MVAADVKRAEVKKEEGLDEAMEGAEGDAAGPSGEPPSALSDVHRAFLRLTGKGEEGPAGVAEAPGADAQPKEEDAQRDQFADDGDGDGAEGERLSKKKRKELETMKVAELKRTCSRPDVVEVWDVRAPDPHLLVHLKAYRNAVPVPRHWSQKRQYLQGKRGLEKPPFELPEYIKATGITGMRDAYLEKEAASKQKQQARSRMRPKMGKIEIEYEVMYDAFFKYQTKPKMSRVGDLYYEGKEFEMRPEGLVPGTISDALREALGMEGELEPPPWLRHMQRYGPPPSYPDLKIPGLSAPIPKGAMFGYDPGMWGKPPVDEMGRPLYGDVFGELGAEVEDLGVDKEARWGAFQEVEEEEFSSSEEEEEEAGEGEDPETADGLRTGVATTATLPPGVATPAMVDIRKQVPDSAAPTPLPAGAPKELYTVLEQQKASLGATSLMGSAHTYAIPGGKDKKAEALAKLNSVRGEVAGASEVTVDPSEIEGMSDAEIRALYQRRLAEARSSAGREDLSGMVAARAAQQARKRDDKRKADEEERFKF